MEEIKKVKIFKECYDTTYCERCDEYFCSSCIDFYEVEFDIIENVFEDRPQFPEQNKNWKGKDVCQWCYNQLVDKKNAEN